MIDWRQAMTPEEAVEHIINITADIPEFLEEDVYDTMFEAGVPDDIADRAFKFTQIAWGQVCLNDLGVTPNPNYLCFNADGEIIESGLLTEEPYFIAAKAAAQRSPLPAGLPRLALMSADVHAVNDHLLGGANPADLITGPQAMFMEAPNPGAVEKAQDLLREWINHKIS
jgi:hypothetical protein